MFYAELSILNNLFKNIFTFFSTIYRYIKIKNLQKINKAFNKIKKNKFSKD